MNKSAEAFRTISEVAAELAIPKHVLRFWEGRFPQIRPMKRGGGRRYYRPEDLDLLRGIRQLLHNEGYTIKGVQKILRESGVDEVKKWGRTGTASAPPKRAPAKSGKSSIAGSRAVVASAIKELEACRDLLSPAGQAAAERVGKPGRTG